MARFIKAQVRLHRNNGLPEDDCINVFHFDSDANDTSAVLDHIHAGLTEYYNSIESILAGVLSGNATVKYYDLADEPPRALLRTQGFTFQVGTSDVLPAEVAIVGTLLCTDRVDMPIEYRRGRTYVGPINNQAISGAASGPDALVTSGARTLVSDALEGLAKRTIAEGPPAIHTTLAIYSPTWHNGRGPTSGGGPGGRPPRPALDPHSLDDSVNDVTEIRINNALDTQRRRGIKATAQTVKLVS